MISINILVTVVIATLLSSTKSFAAPCGAYVGAVRTAIKNGGCDSSVAMPLSRQIADEMICILGADKLTIVNSVPGKTNLGPAALGLLSPAAKNALVRATNNGSPKLGALQINSALRSVVQQHMLYQWWITGKCNYLAVARPGRSNHESARAIDVNNNAAWKPYLEAQGFKRLAGDEVHFDYLSSPDLRGYDILAFQRLWNRNNPCDQIKEDSQWGPATELRVGASPVAGFPIGKTCDVASHGSCSVPNVGSGKCYDVNQVTCRGTRGIGFYSGHCPGAANIQCCVGTTARGVDSADAGDTTVLAVGLVGGALGCVVIGGVIARRRKRTTSDRGMVTSFSSSSNNNLFRQSGYIGDIDIPENAYK